MTAAPINIRSVVRAVVIGAALLWAPTHAEPPPTPRIGVLFWQVPYAGAHNPLRDGLHDLGYVEGKNIVIEWRQFAGTVEEARPLVAELLRLQVDLIVTLNTPASRAALEATKTVPVVFVVGDPIATGLAASLAKPGANATGISVVATELTAKRLDLLCQIVPRARRIVYLWNSSNPLGPHALQEAQGAAKALGVRLEPVDARSLDRIDAALDSIKRMRADALLLSEDLLFARDRAKIARAVREAKLPAIFAWSDYHEHEVLMSYGNKLGEATRHAAVYIDKILKGAKPSDLPIEQVSKYTLIINLRVAHALGLEVPQGLLLRADEVIR